MVCGVNMWKPRLVASTFWTTAGGTDPSKVPVRQCSERLKGVEEFERGGNAGTMGVRA
jgi:hypothetical protein